MAAEVEIIQPGGAQPEPDHLESNDSVQTGNPLAGYAAAALGLLVAAAFFLSLVGGEEQPARQEQSTTTLAPRGQNDQAGVGNDDSTNEPAGAHSAEAQARRSSITPSDRGQSLIIIENSQFIYEMDLSNGRRSSWSPPEILVDADPLIVGDEVVVIGESGAWIGKPLNLQWRFLAEANRVMPSSEVGRMWLQTNIVIPDSSASEYRWTEIDATGQIFRTMLRDLPVTLPTPEIAVGSEGGIMRFSGSDQNPWQSLSETGVLVASGLNDMVVAECDANSTCKRFWYDPSSSSPKAGFYPDLAENLIVDDATAGSLLSPDGRFIVSRSSLDPVTIISVVTGRRIENSCLFGRPTVWAAASEVFVCSTPEGSELYETDDGESLGMVIFGPDKWARMAFIPTDRILRVSR